MAAAARQAQSMSWLGNSMAMRIQVVDDKDIEIAERTFETINYQTDIYRVAAIWVFNDHGEVLLAQRQFNKEHSPGAWGPSAAGTVEVGESYQENILKETAEEIGINITEADLLIGPKRLTTANHPTRRYFTQWFYARCNQPAESFVLQEDEVAAVRWVDKADIEKEVTEKTSTYIDSFSDITNFIPEPHALPKS